MQPVTDRARARSWVHRRWRWLAAGCAGFLLLCTAAMLLGTSWYLANLLDEQAFHADHSPDPVNLSVEAVEDGRVRLAARGAKADGDWRRPGVYGLKWQSGYAQVGAIRASGSGWVERDLTVLEGALQPGVGARVDALAFPPDPQRAFGYLFSEVNVAGELGGMPAWQVDAAGRDWAVVVHGQNADRSKMLRELRPLHQAGLTALMITYRNDEGAPASADGRLAYGADEWRDLDACVSYARAHGARHIVLVGDSMGGAIVMSFLYHSSQAAVVAGAILDAPMLDFDATVRFRAPGVFPGFFITGGEWVASLRFGVDWGALDYLSRASELATPILLFHGDEDRRVPIATSDQLAALRPELVTYERVRGAAHVRSWNLDPGAYENAIKIFLGRVLAGR